MRKLMILGTVLMVLALVFTGCPKEPDPQKTDPVYTDINLVATVSGTALTNNAVRPGNSVVITANVIATDGTNGGAAANKTYRIDVVGTLPTGVTSTYTTASGPRTFTIANDAVDGVQFAVTAVSLAVNTLTKSQTYIVVGGTDPIVPAISITITADDETIEELETGETLELTAVILPVNATQTLNWSVSPPTAASITVDTSDPLKATLTALMVSADTEVVVTAQGVGASGTFSGVTILGNADYKPATALADITAADGITELEESATVVLTTVVTPVDSDDAVSWSITAGGSAASISPATGLTTTLTAGSVASDTPVTVTATAGTLSKTITITVKAPGTGPVTPLDLTWKWLNVLNSGVGTINAQTMTEVPVANTNKRYVVSNNEPLGTIDRNAALADGQGDAFRDVSVMYIETPFSSDVNNWEEIGITARIKISGQKTPWANAVGTNADDLSRAGIIMGAMEDPETFADRFTADATGKLALKIDMVPPAFMGLRKAIGGQIRAYDLRADYPANGYGSTSSGATEGAISENIPGTTTTWLSQISPSAFYDWTGPIPFPVDTTQWIENTEKIEMFADQEFIFEVKRPTPAQYRVNVWDAQGLDILFGFTTSGNHAGYPTITDDNAVYLGFLIYGCEAEISDIVITANGQTWADPAVAGAAPSTVLPRRVDFDGFPDNNLNMAGFDYSVQQDDFPASFTLTSTVIPRTLVQTGTWSATGSVSVNTNGVVTLSSTIGDGTGTVTFTPTAGGNAGTANINVLTGAIAVTGVEISAALDLINAGGSPLQLYAKVSPDGSDPAVTWSLQSPVTGVSIDEDTGLLTADSSATGTVTVVATTVGENAGGNEETDTFTVTIGAATNVLWTLNPNDITTNPTNNTVVLTVDSKSVIKGGGSFGVAAAADQTTTPGALINSLHLIGGARFLVGASSVAQADWEGVGANNASNNTSYNKTAEFDFSVKKVKITVKYAYAGDGNSFALALNTYAGSNGNGPVDTSDAVYLLTADGETITMSSSSAGGGIFNVNAGAQSAGEEVVLEALIDPAQLKLVNAALAEEDADGNPIPGLPLVLADVLGHTFLGFRASGSAEPFINYICVEYVEE